MIIPRLALIILLISTFIFSTTETYGQNEASKDYIDIAIGLGLASPYDESESEDRNGFYIQTEYVFTAYSWLSLRPYLGYVNARSKDIIVENENDLTNYLVSANTLLLGGKARITAPIPWVAPYFEIGYGVSIGSLRTFTPTLDIEKNGFTPHLPFSLGLSIGKAEKFEIEFTYYYHSTAELYSGAVAFGISIPIDDIKRLFKKERL